MQRPVTPRPSDTLHNLASLPDIPVMNTGPDFALATLDAHLEHAHDLLNVASGRVPPALLRQLDKVSRAWLEKWENEHLPEIDSVAATLNRPGAYFFSVNYEWGCTCRVGPATDGASAVLARVLDWRTPGLGRTIIAANVATPHGPFTTLTWPGYTGVLSASAPHRFSAALNQAPMRQSSGFFVFDWAANRHRVWHMGHPTPAHLLRRVFETAPDFKTAEEMLIKTPISTPAIFLLAGLEQHETRIIERKEQEAHVVRGAAVAANHWQAPGWTGRPRGRDSHGRAARMHDVKSDMDPDFTWLKPPILNDRTRLIMIADAAKSTVVAQGYEGLAPATQVLKLNQAA